VGAGILLGAGLPAAWGLDFAAPLAFIALTIPFVRDRATAAAAVAAAATVAAAWTLPARLGLVAAALAGIVVGMLARRRA
jgi:predicted branched-subunit amino acid permease